MKITRKQLKRLIEVYVVTPEGEAHDARKKFKGKNDSLETKIKQTAPGLERLMDKIPSWQQQAHTVPRGKRDADDYSDAISQPYSLYSAMTDDDVEGAILDHETEHPERGMHYDQELETGIQSASFAIYGLAAEIDMMGLGLADKDFAGWNPPAGYPDVAESIVAGLLKNKIAVTWLEDLGDYINSDAFMKKYAEPLYDSQVAKKTFIDIIRKAHKASTAK